MKKHEEINKELENKNRKLESENKKHEEINRELESKNRQLESENKELKSKNKKYIIFNSIVYILIIISGLYYCLFSNKIEQPKVQEVINKIEPYIDLTDFKNDWNRKIYNIKYENNSLDIEFTKYELDNKIQKEIESYLIVDRDKLINLQVKLKESKNNIVYIPLISWIDERLNLKSIDSKTIQDSREMMNYITKVVNPAKSFSDKIVDKIIELNEFCYYFKQHKDTLYQNGYSRNIKSCRDIEIIFNSEESLNSTKFTF